MRSLAAQLFALCSALSVVILCALAVAWSLISAPAFGFSRGGIRWQLAPQGADIVLDNSPQLQAERATFRTEDAVLQENAWDLAVRASALDRSLRRQPDEATRQHLETL